MATAVSSLREAHTNFSSFGNGHASSFQQRRKTCNLPHRPVHWASTEVPTVLEGSLQDTLVEGRLEGQSGLLENREDLCGYRHEGPEVEGLLLTFTDTAVSQAL